jgi:hypothetical protein
MLWYGGGEGGSGGRGGGGSMIKTIGVIVSSHGATCLRSN